MRFRLAGLLKELVIERLNDRALVRASEIVPLVRIVQDLGSERLEVHIVADAVALYGLAAAVDAAAGARHDLDEEIVLLSLLDH